MISDDTIINFLSLYQLPAIFLGSFFFGESVIITAAFLSAQGFWSPINVFWLSLLGTITSDSLWFLFGRRIMVFFHKWENYKGRSERLLATLENITGKKPFLSLLFIKFLYGTRILTIMYLSMRKMKLLTFVIFDTIGSIIWLVTMIAIGWLAGKSIINLAPSLNKFEYAALFLVLVIVVFKIGTQWFSKKITKE